MNPFTAFFSSGASKLVDSVGDVIDDVTTTEEERLEFSLKTLRVEAEQNLGQMEILKADANSSNWFQASWRPMIGWIGAFSLGWNFIVHPLFTWVALLYNPEFKLPPLTDLSQLYPIVLGMLGIGAFRSFDKFKKTDTK